MSKGIDISAHNGFIDFNKLKDKVDFVIIRAGYGKHYIQKDQYFERNYIECKRVGIPVGAYWYSYATSVEEAQEEARTFLKVIGNRQFEFPLYYDIEEKKQMQKGLYMDLITAFCTVLESEGYYAGVYSSKSALENYADSNIGNKYTVWVAQWGKSCTYKSRYAMWQHSSTGAYEGIVGNVDENICYKDFDSIMKFNGLNGYTKPVSEAEKPIDDKDELDQAVELMKKYNEKMMNGE